MSWSVTVNDIPAYEDFPLELQEFFASQHPSYPRDAYMALTIAKVLGLRSATLTGMRTPNPYGGDEIVDVSVRGTPLYKDFLLEMREIIASGIDADSDLARHWAALARLRQHPCAHVFAPAAIGNIRICQGCGVYLNGTMLSFPEGEE
jgi:hypothetical protein